MPTVEQIIDEQYVLLSRKFKPVFGNLKHIDIAKDMVRLGGLEKELQKKVAASKGAETLVNDIKRIKRNLVSQFKNI